MSESSRATKDGPPCASCESYRREDDDTFRCYASHTFGNFSCFCLPKIDEPEDRWIERCAKLERRLAAVEAAIDPRRDDERE